jgi:hypothetical protein
LAPEVLAAAATQRSATRMSLKPGTKLGPYKIISAIEATKAREL